MPKDPSQTLKAKINQIDRRIRTSDLSAFNAQLASNVPAKIEALNTTLASIKGTPLEGLPYAIACLKSSFLNEKEIAEQLDIPIGAVRKYSRVEGFDHLMNRLSNAMWVDMNQAAMAALQFHMVVWKDKDIAKWWMESSGQVQSNKPVTLHRHDNKTIVMNGGGVQQNLPALPGGGGGQASSLDAVELAGALFDRFKGNLKEGNPAPPINISED